MIANSAKLLDFLRRSPQFVIPIYQRSYSWTEKECGQLWDDIIRCGNDDHIPMHFIGSIVYIESGLSQVTHQSPLLVIDGQQRLTSISLLLTALAEAINDDEEPPFDGFSKSKIRNYFLLNPEEKDDRHFKLLLSQTDKETLIALVGNRPIPENVSIRIKNNYETFKHLIRDNESNLSVICKGLAKLVVVDIALNREQDNPQLIFESMNSTGKELSQADLIRNFVLMGLEPEIQTRLYQNLWRPMEIEFGQEGYSAYFDGFMRHYLTVLSGDIPNINAVYDAFKFHASKTRGKASNNDEHIEMLINDIREYASYFCSMALGKEKDPTLKQAFHDLRELRVDVSYPFLLELYKDYATQKLTKDDFVRIVRWIESYVLRRAICAIPTNSMNKTFATFGKSLKKDKYLDSVAAQFLLLPSYRRFPPDNEFESAIQKRDLYNFRSRSYLLRRFENHNRKEIVSVDEYTIEHILPQNENLNADWRKSLGLDWKNIQQTWLHTLGNLTLTGYNSEYSDRAFTEKRDMEGGFKSSPLKLNHGLGQIDIWNENAIIERAQKLAKIAVNVWESPKLDSIILDTYRPKRHASNYTINDHPYLLTPTLRNLFESFSKEVMALDPCVTEEFLKLYVAYKAETNFTDVVPQAKRLRISLNMSFEEISDPKGLCKDVSQSGRWGNGDIEVGLDSLDNLPYVIGLVRQALEKQLGDLTNT